MTTMSPNPPETTSNSNYDLIFENALKAYKKKTGKDLTSDPLLRRLESCDSPDTVLGALREQIPDSGRSGTRDDRLMNWLDPTVNVLLSFSATIGGAISLPYPPAGLIFTGIGSLLSVVQAVSASRGVIIELFERIENFFRRLETYIGLPRTAEMMEVIVNVMVEVLIIIGLVTKEMKQGKIKRFLKKLIGRPDIKDALQRLDNLAQEESRMAAAQGLKGVGERLDLVIDGGERLRGELQQVANDVDDQKRKQLRQDFEKWLSPPDPTINYNTASDAHHQGTAEWFTSSTVFRDWNATGCFMWIHGKPGSGKSVLTSAIIQDIRNARSGLMAFFFCDFKDTAKQNIRALLSSLIVQLSYQSDSFYKILHDFYSTHRDGSQQPSVGALTQCLGDMLKVPGETPIYLIIDALDECPGTSGIKSPREEVLGLVTALVELHISSLHLCVTSRPEIDIRTILEPLTSTSNRVSLHDQNGQRNDIVDYVTSVVYQDIKMKKWREDDKRHVIETLSERADGMFRWVFCQLEVLRHCLAPSVRTILAELPQSLDETYERILLEIPRANRVHAHRLLQCLTVAIRPLTVEELAEVLAIDFPEAGGIPKLKEGCRWEDQEQAVLSACSSLISIVQDRRSRRVQFSHFSVKEFLTSDRLTDSTVAASRYFRISLEPAHTIMAQACLGVLLRIDDKMDDETIKSYPLAKYAGQHFTNHADFENVLPQISDGFDDLFDPDKPHFEAWCRLNDDINRLDDSPLSVCSRQSSWDSDLDDSGHDPDELSPDSNKSSSDLGHSGANSDQLKPNHPFTRYSLQGLTPLHCAMFLQHLFLSQYLISKRPQDLHVNHRGLTPWHLGMGNRDVKIARLVLEHCADLDIKAVKGWTLLHIAAWVGSVEVTRMLLERHAAINARDYKGRTPLCCATYEVKFDKADAFGCARLLLENGADVDAQDNRGLTPLHVASYRANDRTVQLLFEHGASISLRDSKGETALHRASRYGRVNSTRLLIDHGADMDAQDNKGSTPLHLAASKADTGIAELLLDRGANVDVQNNEGWTPLHLAASEGKTWVAELLLDRGANVDVQNNEGLTPLHLAASEGKTWVAELLLDRGANTDVQNKEGSTSLHLAASKGETWIAELLLDRGANIHVQNNEGQTPLQVSSRSVEDLLSEYMQGLQEAH